MRKGHFHATPSTGHFYVGSCHNVQLPLRRGKLWSILPDSTSDCAPRGVLRGASLYLSSFGLRSLLRTRALSNSTQRNGLSSGACCHTGDVVLVLLSTVVAAHGVSLSISGSFRGSCGAIDNDSCRSQWCGCSTDAETIGTDRDTSGNELSPVAAVFQYSTGLSTEEVRSHDTPHLPDESTCSRRIVLRTRACALVR